jgi:hypothetical protein
MLFLLLAMFQTFQGEAKVNINGVEIVIPFSGTITDEPITNEPILPDPIRIINVTPENASTILKTPKPQPGDHYIFSSGNYQLSNLVINAKGTVENPIAYIANGTVTIEADMEIGRHEAVWILKGQHVWVQGLIFLQSGGGNQIAVRSSGSWLSHDVIFKDTKFRRSDGKSVICTGNNFSFYDCEWTECCQRNPIDGGPEAFVVGTWHYKDANGNFQLSKNIKWLRCTGKRNRGEWLHPSYCDGVLIDKCIGTDAARFSVFHAHNANNVVIINNTIITIDPLLTHTGKPPWAVVGSIEGGAFENQAGSANWLIRNNNFNGGRGINWGSGLSSSNPWSSYRDWTVKNNNVTNTDGPQLYVEKHRGYEPVNCTHDLTDVLLKEPEFWNQ